jgi:hypothetical protein
VKWCDLACEHASFPRAEAVDGAGSCRTFAALYCARLNKLVHKHGLCQVDEPPGSPEGRAPATPGHKEEF